MAQGKITFSGGETPSVEELAGGVPPQVNLFTDAAGALRVRPGIREWADFPAVIPNASPVVAIAIWNQYLVYVTEDRKLWAILSPGYVVALSSASASTKLDGTGRPTIATLRTMVIFAGGGKPQVWSGVGLSARLGGSPPNFSHVVTMTLRVVGNDSGPSGIMYWSDIGDPGATTWLTGLNFAEAEAKPDPVIGLYESAGELVALGTKTIQMFSPDPSVVFSPARIIPFGVVSGHIFAAVDEQFVTLDTKDRAMLSNGRSYSAIGAPAVAKQLTELGTVSDGWAFRFVANGYDCAVLRFPTSGKTMVYDVPSKAWSEWRGYSTATGTYQDFLPTSHVYWEEQRTHLVGLADGRIAELTFDAVDDLGTPIVTEATTTFVDHGVLEQKWCQRVAFRFRTGPTLEGCVVHIAYRDDLGPFCDPFIFDLGPDSDLEARIESLGVYMARQWRISCADARLSFATASETFTMTRV